MGSIQFRQHDGVKHGFPLVAHMQANDQKNNRSQNAQEPYRQSADIR
jgi:hypothetical protein